MEITWRKVGKFLLKQILGFVSFFLIIRSFNWLVQRSEETKPRVRLASLAMLELSRPNSTLGYDLWFDLQFDQYVADGKYDFPVHNRHLRAAVFYAGAKVGPTDDTLPPFKQYLTNTTVIHQDMQGQAADVSAAVVEAFEREKVEGFFSLQLKVRFAKKLYKGGYAYAYKYSCPLRFPVPNNDTPAVLKEVKCRRKWGW